MQTRMDIDASISARTPPNTVEAQAPGSSMRRPRATDEPIVKEAACRIAAACATWDEGSTPESWIEPLVKCRHDWNDGYDLARALETQALVTPNSELVEILSDASRLLDDVHAESVRQWVRIVGFAPAHAVGDAVQCRHGQGTVHSVHTDTAQYVVSTDGRTNGGWILNAEDVTAPDTQSNP